MLSEQEIKERHAAVRNAIASQRLEGLDLDQETIADLERVARGETDTAEVLNNLHRRVASGYFRFR